jgi:hypothetical protein
MITPSLNDLIMFVPSNYSEYITEPGETALSDYIKTTKTSFSNGHYWLGGQIKMHPDDKITLSLLQKATELNTNPYYCNSWEYQSIQYSIRLLSEIQKIIIRYETIMKQRIMKELEKTCLNTDVNNNIISFI